LDVSVPQARAVFLTFAHGFSLISLCVTASEKMPESVVISEFTERGILCLPFLVGVLIRVRLNDSTASGEICPRGRSPKNRQSTFACDS
jgi:hypothetical protein